MRVFAVIAVCAATASAQPAPGPPVPPEPTAAVRAFQAGRALLEAGKYAEACEQFTASIKQDPDAPGTLLNLGLCNEKLGRIATALGWYRKAQVRAAEAQMAEYEAAAKGQTVSLAPKVPTLRIDAPAGAEVVLDGVALSDVDRARVEVDPGGHVVESGAIRRTIDIREGDKRTIDLVPPPPPPPAPVKRYVVVDRGASQRHYAYLAAGAGGALYIASVTLSLVGKSKYEAADHPETYFHWQDVVRYGGTSLFVLGSAALATGAYLYIKAPKAERIEQVAPVVGPSQIGVAVAGHF